MKGLELFAITMLLLTQGGLAQDYHDTSYLTGGYGSLCQKYELPGVWIVRADGSATSLFSPGYDPYSFCMDTDNKKIVFCVGTPIGPSTCYQGPHSGIYRYDPKMMTYETVYGPDTMTCVLPWRLHINQDGDYVFSGRHLTWTGTRFETNHSLFKADRQGTLSTVLSTIALGRRAFINGRVERNIDTGNYLVSDRISMTSPSTISCPILEVADDGTFNTWSTGGRSGWGNPWCMPQEHSTGFIVGPWDYFIYLLKPGTTSLTKLVTIKVGSTPVNLFYNFKYDLQTAARKRWVGTPVSWNDSSGMKSWIAYLDRSGAVTSIKLNGLPANSHLYYNDFAFYRGRHIQTIRTAPGTWDIRLSCPRFPGKRYVLVAGMTGVRPGIPLPDGRNINLNYDVYTHMTLWNVIPTIFNPGPGWLDANGEAVGKIDLSTFPQPFGIPFWMAVLVLDPQAQSGVAYLPDTYGMRI